MRLNLKLCKHIQSIVQAILHLFDTSVTKAVLDLCKWPTPTFMSLLDVLEKYENYETEDVKEVKKATVHMNQGKLSRGQTMTMTNKMIVKLSRMDAELFLTECAGILTNKKSLREVIENSEKTKRRIEVVRALEFIAKKDYAEIASSFPDMFSEKNLEEYIGAEVSNEKLNAKGELLKRYYEAVYEDRQNGVLVKVFGEVGDLTVDDLMKDTDLLVIRPNETEKGNEVFENILELIYKTEVCSVILFEEEVQQQNALMYLKSRPEKEDFEVNQIFFEKEKFVIKRNIGENLEFGVVCGKLDIRNGPLLSFNGSLHNLTRVCHQLTKPNDRICHVTEGNTKVTAIHEINDLTRSVTYYCSTQNCLSLKESLMAAGFLGNTVERPKSTPTPTTPSLESSPRSPASELSPRQSPSPSSPGSQRLSPRQTPSPKSVGHLGTSLGSPSFSSSLGQHSPTSSLQTLQSPSRQPLLSSSLTSPIPSPGTVIMPEALLSSGSVGSPMSSKTQNTPVDDEYDFDSNTVIPATPPIVIQTRYRK